MAHFDYYSVARQIAEYEKRRPKNYRNSGWRYYNGDYRGGKYGKLLPETGWVFYDTQAWGALKKCWLGYNIAKSQNDIKNLRWYAEGIRKFQKELRLPINSFRNLGLYDTDEDSSDSANIEEDGPYDYESPAQRRWKERINAYYSP